MKLPTYSKETAAWDAYNRFHNDLGTSAILFESGEMIFNSARFASYSRSWTRPPHKFGGECSIRIATTFDGRCPKFKFVPDEALASTLAGLGHDPNKLFDTTIPASWIGSHTVLADMDTGRTVALGYARTGKHDAWAQVPTWIKQANRYSSAPAAYIPGNGADAVGSKITLGVTVKRPYAVQKAMRDLRSAAIAWCEMCNWNAREVAPKYYNMWTRTPVTLGQLPRGVDTELADMQPETIFSLAQYGYVTEAREVTVDSIKAVVAQ